MLEHISIHCINNYPCILGRLLYIIGGHGAGSLAPLWPCPWWHGPALTCSGPPSLDGVAAAAWTKFFLCIQSGITCHDSKFKFMNFKFISKKIFTMDLESCVKKVRSSMVKTVFESDASLRNYNEKTKEIRLDGCMHACVGLVRLCQVECPARGEVSMR